jgi:cytochrome c oxidase assembly protein subunit 15
MNVQAHCQTLRPVRVWLLSLWALVLLMVMIGGVTRLTGSGLSIVEWRPVSGALPPLSEHAWQDAFAAYQRSPQYRIQNQWMGLPDFKRIFFWEYFHRLFGRLIGVAFVVPWLWLLLTRRLGGALARRTASILVLGGLQGLVGWYMVKSGLVNEPQVSHYRLALHLVLAFSVGQWILWQALDLASPRDAARRLPAKDRRLVLGLLHLLMLQVVYGAFMAGKHAGYLFSTFPDMNGRYLPFSFFGPRSLVHDLLENPLSIHYLHRLLALGVSCYTLALAYRLRSARPPLRTAVHLLLAVTLGQVVLGALTVVLHMPLWLAVAHQGGAYVLVSAAVALYHATLTGNRLAEAAHDTEARARDGGLTGSRQDLRRA